MKIVLASASPRRRELISIICDDFEVRPCGADEVLPTTAAPSEAAGYLARLKADASCIADGEAVIGCDTVVVCEGEIMGKPADAAECRKMLGRLSGKTHEVFTGVCVRTKAETFSFTERTEVTFFELSDAEIEEYIATGEPFDKAGGYGIQGRGAILVKKINGDYFNVVGLPLSRLFRELKAHGIL